MACTQYTLEQYQALSDAIASGAIEVQYGDKTVKYRTFAEMRAILSLMRDCLFPPANGGSNNGRKFASFKKGTY